MIVWVALGIAGWLAIVLALLGLFMVSSQADRALERQREERLRREQGVEDQVSKPTGGTTWSS